MRGRDGVVVDAGRQGDLSLEGTVATLDAMPLLVLVLLVGAHLVLPRNGQHLVGILNLCETESECNSHFREKKNCNADLDLVLWNSGQLHVDVNGVLVLVNVDAGNKGLAR